MLKPVQMQKVTTGRPPHGLLHPWPPSAPKISSPGNSKEHSLAPTAHDLSKQGSRKLIRETRIPPEPSDSPSQQLHAIGGVESGGGGKNETHGDAVDMIPARLPADVQRIEYLEKSMEFLKTQHVELVSGLHEEVDRLKRNNKELQFCIVMMQKDSTTTNERERSAERLRDDLMNNESASKCDSLNMASVSRCLNSDVSRVCGGEPESLCSTRATDVPPTQGDVTGTIIPPPHPPHLDPRLHSSQLQAAERLAELRVLFHENEMKEMRRALEAERAQSQQLMERLHRVQQSQAAASSADPSGNGSQPVVHRRVDSSETTQRPLGGQPAGGGSRGPYPSIPFSATLDPLLVHFPPARPRPPTLRECQVVVRYLQQLCDRQAHELTQLKADLRDVFYSHKWTPDAFLLARAYVMDDDERGGEARDGGGARERGVAGEGSISLTRVPMKHVTRKLPDAAYVTHDVNSLPPITNTLGAPSLERQRRTQVLQRSRASRYQP